MTKPAKLPHNESERLATLKNYNILDTPPEEAFDKITLLTSQLFSAPITLISLVDENRQWFKSKCGLEADETPRDIAFCAHAILDQDVMFVPDATKDERFRNNPLVTGPPHIRTYAGAPLTTPEGHRLGTLCVIFDKITPLTDLQRTQLKTLASLVVDEMGFRQSLTDADNARKAAEAANAAKSSFLAVMSHEIRTPLNGVLGAADVLSNTSLTSKQNEFVDTVKQSGILLLDLLNDILDLSKIEAGHIKLEEVEFSIEELLNTAKGLWSGKAREKGLKFSIQNNLADVARIRSDPTRLRQIINNLIGNAIKFTSEGEIELRVEEASRKKGRIELRFEIRDTGIGISAEHRKNLFAPFTQADSSTTRKFGGTGLGLAISKNLVALLGGNINVDSEPDRGTSFFFTISALPGLRKEDVAKPVADSTEHHNNSFDRPLRILVAEDNHINQKVVSWMLTPIQGQIHMVSNGLEAVAAVMRSSYDIVLMDINMPELDGVKATEKIRSLGGVAGQVPIIAMTANAMEGDRERYLDAGMNDHVPKPFDQEKLFKAISNAVAISLPTPNDSQEPSPFSTSDKQQPLSGEAAKEIGDFIDNLDDVLKGTGA